MTKIVAVMVVRNEADLLECNLRYHMSQGVTEFRVVDNGSSDGTRDRLRDMSRRLNILWTSEEGAYHQSEIVTGLAAEAFRGGADWILPVDADEFWSGGNRSLTQALEASTAEAVEAEVVTFVQERSVRTAGAAALLTMLHRPIAIYSYHRCRELIESRQIAFVEMQYPTKWLPRASADLRIEAGAHGIAPTATTGAASSEIVCWHAPLRSRHVLDARAEHGRRLVNAGYSPEHGWQNQRWHHLQILGQLDAEWDANSTQGGYLELGHRRTPLVFDPRLSNAVRPWIATASD